MLRDSDGDGDRDGETRLSGGDRLALGGDLAFFVIDNGAVPFGYGELGELGLGVRGPKGRAVIG